MKMPIVVWIKEEKGRFRFSEVTGFASMDAYRGERKRRKRERVREFWLQKLGKEGIRVRGYFLWRESNGIFGGKRRTKRVGFISKPVG